MISDSAFLPGVALSKMRVTLLFIITVTTLSAKCYSWGSDKAEPQSYAAGLLRVDRRHQNSISYYSNGNHKLAYITLIMLMYDTEPNPGPPKYPCGTCNKAVTWKHKGVCCDRCDKWYHIDCQNLRNTIYEGLGNSNVSWECLQCGLPNFSSAIFGPSSNFTIENSYSVLGSSHSRLGSVGSPGAPLAASSPKPPSNEQRKNHHQPRYLKVLNVNCQSIVNKKAEFQNIMDSTDADIVIATETWLKEGKHQDGEIGIAGGFSNTYKIYRKDRKDGYGGVLIGVKNTLCSTRVPEMENDGENVWVKIGVKGAKMLYVGAVYRPHEGDEVGHEQIKASLNKLATYPNANIWLCGDLNYPGIDWPTSALKPDCRHRRLHQDLIDTLSDLGLQQIIEEPTRDTNTLDLFITNKRDNISKAQVIPGISDHDAVVVEGNIIPSTLKQPQRSIPLYDRGDWEGFKQHVREFNIRMEQTEYTDTNALWKDIKGIIDEGIGKFIPHKLARGRNSLPWMSSEVRKMVRKKNRLYTKMKRSGNAKDKDAYRKVKASVQKKMRQSYWGYVENIVQEEDTDSRKTGNKKFWTYIKSCKQDTTGIAPLLGDDGKLAEDGRGKAEILNTQFTSVFSKLSPCTLTQMAGKAVRNLNIHSVPDQHLSPHPTMPDLLITTKGVDKLLANLKPHKAAGPDSIKPRVLKELHVELAPVFTKLFSKSLQEGKMPDDWRKANVTPIYKKGAKHLAVNYRPVSLTCVACKVMEHIIASNIMSHLETNGILYARQHGFRSRRSCETQLLEFIQELHSNNETGTPTDLVVMDFSKAFDKVPHEKLLYKLDYYGIQGQTLAWVKDFLRDRQQSVVVDGCKSSSSSVLSGVPQGSVLGPMLFLAFINDLPSCVSSSVRLFADDTIMYRPITSTSDTGILQKDLENLDKWSETWQMDFHPSKCEVMRVQRGKKQLVNPPTYTLQGQSLKWVHGIKYLGVQITSDLSWNTHISAVTSQANRKLGFVRRNLQIGSHKVKAMAYKGLIRSNLEYCATVWSPHTKSYIRKVEMVQHRAARWAVNRYHNTSSVSHMLNQLEWSSLEQRRKELTVCMLYKAFNDLVAIDPYQYLAPVSRPTRHSHPYSVIVPHCRTDSYKHSFFPRAAVLWNALPSSVVLAPSLESFRQTIRKPGVLPN